MDASQSVHSLSAVKQQEDAIVIEDDDYSFDEEPIIELKTKANQGSVR